MPSDLLQNGSLDDNPRDVLETNQRDLLAPISASEIDVSAEESPSYFEGLSDRLSERGRNIKTVTESYSKGEFGRSKNPKAQAQHAFLREMEEIGGGIYDLVPESVKEYMANAWKTLASVPVQIIPDDVINAMKTAVTPTIDKAEEFAETYPDLAETIIKSPDLFPLFATGIRKSAPRDAKQRIVNWKEKGGDVLGYEVKAVKPYPNKAGRIQTVKQSTTSRWTQKREYLESRIEKELIKEMRTIKDEKGVQQFRLGNTNQRNYDVVNMGIKQEAENLSSLLKTANTKYKRSDLSKLMVKRYHEAIKYDPAYPDKKTANNSFRKAFNRYNKVMKNRPNTSAALLSARKQFDAEYKKLKSARFLSDQPHIITPEERSVEIIRSTMNEMIAKSTPDVAVKSSLLKQRRLFQAQDIMMEKAINEADTMTGRFLQKIEPIIPVGIATGRRM